jgi:hypothetical protein
MGWPGQEPAQPWRSRLIRDAHHSKLHRLQAELAFQNSQRSIYKPGTPPVSSLVDTAQASLAWRQVDDVGRSEWPVPCAPAIRYRLLGASRRGTIECGVELPGTAIAPGLARTPGRSCVGCCPSVVTDVDGRIAAGAFSTLVSDGPGGVNRPVAGSGSGGNSSLTNAAPSAGPIDAVRRLTDCSTMPLSSREPIANARGGLPSTEIRATPWPDGAASGLPLGAITPWSLKRAAASGASAAAAGAATGAAPSNRVRSALAVDVPATAIECAGAAGARTNNRRPQNTTDAATRAQTRNAANRANML